MHRLSFSGVCLFTVQTRHSLTFERLSGLRAGDPATFVREAGRLLERADAPFVECERHALRGWLEAAR